jgi:hypothetical protein
MSVSSKTETATLHKSHLIIFFCFFYLGHFFLPSLFYPAIFVYERAPFGRGKTNRSAHYHVTATVAPLFSTPSKSMIFTRTNCDIPVNSDFSLLPVDAIGGLAGSTSASTAKPARSCPFSAESSLPPRKVPAFLTDSLLSLPAALGGRLGTPCLA